jgi:hypothetical protein
MDERINFAIKNLISGDNEDNWENIQLLTHQYKSEAIPYLLAAIKELDKSLGYNDWKILTEVLADIVGFYGYDKNNVILDLFHLITPLVSDKNIWARATAALYFGWAAKDIRSLPYLVTLYYDEDFGISRVALDSFKRIGIPALWDLKNMLDKAEEDYYYPRRSSDDFGRLRDAICEIWQPRYYPKDWSRVRFEKPSSR